MSQGRFVCQNWEVTGRHWQITSTHWKSGTDELKTLCLKKEYFAILDLNEAQIQIEARHPYRNTTTFYSRLHNGNK